ncbi:MAG: fatty acid desaturase, partial [Methylomonas sp.]|nr:fatty acid desaturase [Methylomonas sp.]
MSLSSYRNVNREQLAQDIKQLYRQAQADLGPADFRHMKRMERWGQVCSLLGYATAWIAPNPVSALLISQGSFARWTQVAHPIQHRGYD